MSKYRHILVATDGSRFAASGVREAVGLAKALGARLTGLYVIAPSPAVYGEAAVYYAGGFREADYRAITEKAARKALDALSSARHAPQACAAQRGS
jgi:nucleotide-binding universal stress UspA family protein